MQPLLHLRIQARGQPVDAAGKDRWVNQTGLEHGRREREVLLRYATSLDTTQSCGSRNAAKARPVDWFDQGTTRPRQPSGSTAVRTLTPCAYTPFNSWNGESSPIAPSTAGCEPAVHDSPAQPDSISPAVATGGGLAGLPMVPTPVPHEGCQDP
jgi:hypothetical protein